VVNVAAKIISAAQRSQLVIKIELTYYDI